MMIVFTKVPRTVHAHAHAHLQTDRHTHKCRMKRQKVFQVAAGTNTRYCSKNENDQLFSIRRANMQHIIEY